MSESAPLVSVLVPARNAAGTLRAALRSLERQTHQNWECIVVDDGSSDDTLALLSHWRERDRRFRAIRQSQGGIVAALNAGLDVCAGELIARMDADDIMHPGRLAAQVMALGAQPGAAAVGSHVRLFPRSSLSAGILAYETWLNGISGPASVRREAFVECPIAHPTLMMRASVLRRLRYRDCGWPEDYDLILRALGDGCELAVVPRQLLLWRDSPGRLSRCGAAYAQSRFVACKAHFLARSLLAGTPEYVLWGYGSTGKALCRALLAQGRRPTHIVEVHPGRIGQTIAGARVVAVSELRYLRDRPIVVSVAGAEPRAEVRMALSDMGFAEGASYVCAA